MKHYFLVAKDVGDLTAIVCAALEERQAKPTRYARPVRAVSGASGDSHRNGGDFAIENRPRHGRRAGGFRARSRQSHQAVLGRRPQWSCDPSRRDAARHPGTQAVDAKLRANPEANRLFLDILTSRNAPEIVLRLMNEAGVLGRFIPEFGRIVALMQFNMYHHYTVDEHLLRAVGNLAEIETAKACQGPSAWRVKFCPRSPIGRRCFSRCSCTTSPRDGWKIIRVAGVDVARSLVSASRSQRRRDRNCGVAGRKSS